MDTYKRAGVYAQLPQLPYTPGTDGAGIIHALGEGVTQFREGDRVWLSGSVTGTYAQYCTANLNDVRLLPEAVSFEQGAGIGVVYRTAYRALFTRVATKPGSVVFVHGASGGVGIAAIQLAISHGCTVVGTAGTPAGLELIRSQGAYAVLHNQEGYMEEVLAMTPEKKGADVILEMAAHANLDKDLKLLKKNGTVVIIGSRGSVEINPRSLMTTEGNIVGLLGLGSPEELQSVFDGIQERLEKGSIKPVAGVKFPLSEAAESHVEVIEHKMGTTGKVILVIEH